MLYYEKGTQITHETPHTPHINITSHPIILHSKKITPKGDYHDHIYLRFHGRRLKAYVKRQ